MADILAIFGTIVARREIQMGMIMEKTDIIIGIVIGLITLAAIAGVIYLAFVGREALRTGNKLVNAGLTLWIAEHLLGAIFGIIILAVVLYGIIVYLVHFGFK
jgi:hypothetical protein